MKKVTKITTIVFLIFGILFLSEPAILVAENEYEIEIPQRLDVSEEETSFTITLLSELNDGTVLNVKTVKNPCLINKEGETVELDVKLSTASFKKKGDVITVTITHEKLDENVWELDLEFTFTPTATKSKAQTKSNVEEAASTKEVVTTREETIVHEKKTLYGLKTVSEWDIENYSLEIPDGPYLARTQYATQTAEFSDSSYSETRPEDGITVEKTLYGYESRTKEEVRTPYTYTHIRYYNAYGACPLGCDSGTENFYGTGCECRMTEYLTDYNISYNYGDWEVQNDSFRMDTPYEESDTIRSISKTVYLTPISFTDNNDWSFEEKSGDSNTKVITRTVYSNALSYNEPTEYSETEPVADSGSEVVSKEFCRIIRNGNPEAWKECD